MKARRLILHLGHGKTGSTSIQRALRASGPVLRAAGILFPDPGRHDNHQLLFPHLHGELPDDPIQMASLAPTAAKARRNAARLLNRLRKQVASERPDTIVLSCENQFRPLPPAAIARLMQHCAELAETTEIVAYLRAPAPFFLSYVQQEVKKRPEFRQISPSRIRDTLEPFTAAAPVLAHRYARDALQGGDVVTDFVSRHLPAVAPEALNRGAAEANSSVSAEAMTLLQEIFRGTRSLPGRYAANRKAFRKIVVDLDPAVPGQTRPELNTPVRAALEARVTDLDWTREALGVDFPGIGPPAMPREEAEAIYRGLRSVADFCAVDEARKEALWQVAMTRATQGLLARFLNR